MLSDKTLTRLADGAALVALTTIAESGPMVLRPGLLPALRRELKVYLEERVETNKADVLADAGDQGEPEGIEMALPLYEGLAITRGDNGHWVVESASTGECTHYADLAYLLQGLPHHLMEV